VWEAVQSKDDHDVDEAFRFKYIVEFVFSDDLISDVSNFHSDELRVFERGVEVKVGDVHCHELCICCRNNTVEQNFGGKHVGSWCGNITGVIDVVPAHYKAGVIGFLLFGLYCAHELAICDVLQSIVGDVFLVHKFDGVGAFDTATHTIS